MATNETRNYQRGGPSGRNANDAAITIKERRGKKTRAIAVRCGDHGTKEHQGLCHIVESAINGLREKLARRTWDETNFSTGRERYEKREKRKAKRKAKRG